MGERGDAPEAVDEKSGKQNEGNPPADRGAKQIGPEKGEFVMPPEVEDADEREDALPQQDEFWRPPTRFGSVPVEKEPLGWDRRRGFRKLFPQVMLPFQVVERVTFGHPDLEPNRLFWGDNLHVMRQLPSESIDLIYIDPPFFSGRQYNVIFGDQNELRSFSDIWEDGMPGYLIWLNARLYEMKRLLKRTGSIYVHLDWHSSHYTKVELDKIFGHDAFQNEIIWFYRRWPTKSRSFQRMHDAILWYTKGDNGKHTFNLQYESASERTLSDYGGKRLTTVATEDGTWVKRQTEGDSEGVPLRDVWEIKRVHTRGYERIGYPTQKPQALLKRLIQASSNEGDVVADFFCGGGTTAAVAQQLGRRWIACDQSRVAVAITADRLTGMAEQRALSGAVAQPDPKPEPQEETGLEPLQPALGGELQAKQTTLGPAEKPSAQKGVFGAVPDFTVEHWGVYETQRLSAMPLEQFRAFVLRCFGAVGEEHQSGIHGMKGAIPVWVGEPNPRKGVAAAHVQDFANAIRKTLRYKQDNLRDGIMLAWAFRQDALDAAERLRRLEHTDLNFIRLDQVRIDSPRFREQVAALSTDHADYENFLTFVQPPRVEVGHKRIASRTYLFDVSETAVMNSGAKIINVQWDFDYRKRFSSTSGYSFVRGAKKEPALQAQYEFSDTGRKRIACKVQDDMGGEGLWSGEIEVT